MMQLDDPREARRIIRAGDYAGHTAGIAPGFVQGNLCILPKGMALDFAAFCQRNPKPCPLIGMGSPGDPSLPGLGDIDIRTDIPRYRVFKDGRLFLVTGSPGGSRIITTVLQVLLNVIDYGMGIADAVHAPRMHHQWLPDQIVVEATVPAATVQALQERGHRIRVSPPFTSANSILVTPGGLIGAADTRTRGALAAGY